jgi:hypothetical protein
MEAALLLATGAIVGLLAARISLAASRSMNEHSRDTLRAALALLSRAERSLDQNRSLDRLRETVEKLDTTVGNLFLHIRQSRTMLERPMQAGELAPGQPPGPVVGTPFQQRTVLRETLPPPGLENPDTPAPSAGERVRARAFGEPT